MVVIFQCFIICSLLSTEIVVILRKDTKPFWVLSHNKLDIKSNYDGLSENQMSVKCVELIRTFIDDFHSVGVSSFFISPTCLSLTHFHSINYSPFNKQLFINIIICLQIFAIIHVFPKEYNLIDDYD